MAKATNLAPAQLRTLGVLTRLPPLHRFYLAGASAIAFHLGHRRSEDLDLFTVTPEVSLATVKRAVLRAVPNVSVIGETDVALHLSMTQVPVDFVKYPHPPVEPLIRGPRNIQVAGLGDLAAMKLAAIARRGIKRDFWDLYAINESGLDLSTAGDLYRRRFGRSEADLYHVQRALTWFVDAEADPVTPSGMTPALWRRIKTHFGRTAPALLPR